MRMSLMLVGFGTVGQGLAELLLERREELARARGAELPVVAIVDATHGSLRAEGGIDLERVLERVARGDSIAERGNAQPVDPLELIGSTDASVMIEATPTDLTTGEPATSYLRAALERGMHVATTNKGPIALHLDELRAVASSSGAELRFEGTVMSGTPLLSLHRHTLPSVGIREVRGILNGTTNFILERIERGDEPSEALAEAQRLGYAETVPDADLFGHDALAKITILAREIFGAVSRPEDFPCRGIESISRREVEAARARGRRIKLLGRVWREGDGVKGAVAPEEIDLDHPLASIGGAANAVTFSTEQLGDVTIVGPGAGRRATAYALLSDILRIGESR
jgi:homoserine dehydrogenase